MTLFDNKIKAEHIYIVSVVAALGLLLFANSDSLINTPDEAIQKLGIGKLFYYPCAVALITSFFIPFKKDVFSSLLLGILICTCVSAIIHPPIGDNVMAWGLTRFVFAILCFRNVANVNPHHIAKCMAIASPLIIVPHYIFSNPFEYGLYRYGGFYGDANFLSFTLLFLIFMCVIAYRTESNNLLKIMYAVTSIFAVPLIFLGRSRSGLISLIVLLIYILFSIGKKNKWKMIVTFALCFGCVLYLYKMFNDSFLYAFERFDSESTTDVISAENRIDQIESVFNVLFSRPDLIPFGIGVGNTLQTLNEYSNYGYYNTQEVHNTFVLFLYEAGMFVALLYICIYIRIIKLIWQNKDYLLASLIFALIVTQMTLPGIAFMPGWVAVFFLCNSELYKIKND